jgi:Tfp pilus assembly protein PilO
MSAGRPFWRARLLPVFLVLLGANAAALAGWTGPRAWRQNNAAARAEAARGEVERQRRAVADLRDRAGAIRDNGADVARFYGTLAGDETVDLLPTLEAVEDLARSPGLRTGGRSVRRAPVTNARVDRVAVTLPLEGSYAQLVGFLGEVERSPRFLTVDRVSMRADREGGGALQVELSAYMRQAPGSGGEGRGGR